MLFRLATSLIVCLACCYSFVASAGGITTGVVAGAGTQSTFRLPPASESELQALQNANKHSAVHRGRALKIGFPRHISADLDFAPISAQSPGWQLVTGGQALRVSVQSPGAAGLRLELRISASFQGELRFSGNADAPGTLHGPYQPVDWQGQPTYWSPITAGDTVFLDIFLPEGLQSGPWGIDLARVSHLVVLPTERNQYGNLYPGTGRCEINVVCDASPDRILASKAVTLMSFVDDGDSFVCSGALISDAPGSSVPYLYTTHHCIDSPVIASTINTYWNFQDSACSGVTDPYDAYTLLTRGASYLNSQADNDHSLLRLNEAAPAGAVALQWDLSDLLSSVPVFAIHHPNGDVKKISYGRTGNPPATSVDIFTDDGVLITHSDTWQVWWERGATERGSSGSPLLTCNGAACRLRGGLSGGSSTCYRDNGPDYYSKFGRAYPNLQHWLESNVLLQSLAVSTGTLSPPFSPSILSYSVTVPNSTASLTLSATAADKRAQIIVNGTSLAPGAGTIQLPLSVGTTRLNVVVMATDGQAQQTSLIVATRQTALPMASQDCLFTWGENRYPEYFSPPQAASQFQHGYYLRYYRITDAYLGVSIQDGHLYYYGPLSNQTLRDLGDAREWFKTAGCQ